MFLSSIAIFLIESEINTLNDSANDSAVYYDYRHAKHFKACILNPAWESGPNVTYD